LAPKKRSEGDVQQAEGNMKKVLAKVKRKSRDGHSSTKHRAGGRGERPFSREGTPLPSWAGEVAREISLSPVSGKTNRHLSNLGKSR